MVLPEFRRRALPPAAAVRHGAAGRHQAQRLHGARHRARLAVGIAAPVQPESARTSPTRRKDACFPTLEDLRGTLGQATTTRSRTHFRNQALTSVRPYGSLLALPSSPCTVCSRAVGPERCGLSCAVSEPNDRMTETLVIRLRASEDAPASWLIVDGNGARSGHRAERPDRRRTLASPRAAAPCWSCPPAEVTLAAPDLPPVRGAARIAQAVPFALEEHLASDLETLHFAIGPRDPASSATPVAIVARVDARALAARPGKRPASTRTRPTPSPR